MAQLSVNPPLEGLKVRVSEILSALSFALDLTEGQAMGHTVNSCLLGMRIAGLAGLSEDDRSELYFALLSKDSGCSSNAARMFELFGGDELRAKREVKTQDWSRVTFDGMNYLLRNVSPGRPFHERLMAIAQVVGQRDKQARIMTEIRCERGAQIALRLGFSWQAAEGIRYLDEHWDGNGYPDGLQGENIPIFSRIMSLAQTLELFTALDGPAEALHVAQERSGTWFDPALVRAAITLESDAELWASLRDGSARSRVVAMQPGGDDRLADDAAIDNICEAFAGIIDAKSPFTQEHSVRVTRAALALAKVLGLREKDVVILRRAALLHDVGKLGVPNSILDKPGKLTAGEWETVRLHPYYTQRILEQISGFQHLAFVASTHHEKIDGSGYHRNLRGSQLPVESRILAVADMFDALSSARPYRAALPMDEVFAILRRGVPQALDPSCVDSLQVVAPSLV